MEVQPCLLKTQSLTVVHFLALRTFYSTGKTHGNPLKQAETIKHKRLLKENKTKNQQNAMA